MFILSEKDMLTNFFYKHWLTLLGIGIGAVGGYWYYATVGCLSGTCPITSSPLNSTAYGAMMGGLLLSSFQKNKNQENKVQ